MSDSEEPASATAVTAKDPKPSPERILQLAQRVLDGDIVLPEFQRPFVWKRRQILELLDSIYRNYPIGSLLVWESHQQLASKRTIADLPVKTKSPQYPANYLLDGQQRLSTICGAINWQPGDPRSVWNLAFDLRSAKFLHLDTDAEPAAHIIPLRRLAKAPEFYRYLAPIDDPVLKSRADLLFTRFLEYQVPLVTLGDMSIDDVAPVFERINSTGMRLTIYDLMRAATWSQDFDLGETIDAIKANLEAKRFDTFDHKTFLRILGASAGGDFSKQSIDALRDFDRDALEEAASAMRTASLLAADFLATEIGAPRAEALPYANQFVVLCELFRIASNPSAPQLAAIKRWFWTTTLSGYFSGWDSGQMVQDTNRVRAFANGDSHALEVPALIPMASVWHLKPFRANSAVSKMLALMLGARQPLDLVNGQRIDVDKSLAWSNDKEFHHFFPQAYLSRKGVGASGSNVVANIILLTSISNIQIRDSAPSEYLAKIIEKDGRPALVERLASNLVPEAALDAALADDLEQFLKIRSDYLHEEARKLTGQPPVASTESAATEDNPDDSADDTTD